LSIEINGPKNPNVAIFSRDLANLLAEQERYRAAEARYKAAMPLFIASYGRTHEQVRQTLADYAAMLRAEGRDEEAASVEAAVAEITATLERASAAETEARSKSR